MNKYFVYTFYDFIKIIDKNSLKLEIDNFTKSKTIRGTILLADEGINASISGNKKDLDHTIAFIKKKINTKIPNLKVNETDFLPFNRFKVRLKKEIVSLGKGKIEVNKNTAIRVNPLNWNKIISDANTILLDVRNTFEIAIGKFENAINLNTVSFREFPSKIISKKYNKNAKVAMYCTGGIRCEKASAYLRSIGYKDLYQLDGGIIKYLEYYKEKKHETLWSGECFVFDERVTIDQNLKKGNYLQCYGCRMPLSEDDLISDKYIKGIVCPHCYKNRSNKQKLSSFMRQKQINIAERSNKNHSFKKITLGSINK